MQCVDSILPRTHFDQLNKDLRFLLAGLKTFKKKLACLFCKGVPVFAICLTLAKFFPGGPPTNLVSAPGRLMAFCINFLGARAICVSYLRFLRTTLRVGLRDILPRVCPATYLRLLRAAAFLRGLPTRLAIIIYSEGICANAQVVDPH